MITVRAHKYDGSEHRSWQAEVLRQEGSLIVLDAVFTEEVQHELLGTIERGTLSLEYYWLDRWYNIFRFQQPSGELRSYYCNVNIPPAFDGEVLSYVDLDIDILVNSDLSYSVIDQDEFEQNATAYGYSQEVRNQARLAVQELTHLIETRDFPFSEPKAVVS
jgi:protein associated with RNAse G/E